MTSEPFDEEWEKDKIVPADSIPSTGQPIPIESVEDFTRRLPNISLDELAFLLAKMKADDPASGPSSQLPG